MENQNKIQEMQMLEQNFQNLLMQKQAFQIEFSETQSALKEIKNSKEDVFKIIGQLMIKTDKSKIEEELLNKEKILDLRIKTIEKQESPLTKQLEEMREEVIKSVKK
jgi:prefoldin beta subunit